MDRSRNDGERGSSLLEILVALLILMFGVFGLAMVQLTAVTAGNPLGSSKARVATDLAQSAIDRFQEVPWGTLRSSSPDGFRSGPEGVAPEYARLSTAAGDAVTFQGTRYYRVWHVVRDIEIPALTTISVWCCWRPEEGPWQHVVLVTQRADAGY